MRPATEADLSALVEMAKAMRDESPRFSKRDFSHVKTANLILNLITHPDGCVLVATAGDEIVGMFGGVVVDHFFGDDRTANDVGLYVKPAHRGGRDAIRLVRCFEQWARERGAKDITLGVSTGIHAERTADLYRLLGYGNAGAMQRKEL